jgi:hypothetical protein
MRSEFARDCGREGLTAPSELRRVLQQIRVADYELHATFRFIAEGEIDSEHIAAFMDASVRRDQMMAYVFSYVAELREQRASAATFARTNGNVRH